MNAWEIGLSQVELICTEVSQFFIVLMSPWITRKTRTLAIFVVEREQRTDRFCDCGKTTVLNDHFVRFWKAAGSGDERGKTHTRSVGLYSLKNVLTLGARCLCFLLKL